MWVVVDGSEGYRLSLRRKGVVEDAPPIGEAGRGAKRAPCVDPAADNVYFEVEIYSQG